MLKIQSKMQNVIKGERELGIDPISGKMIVAQDGKIWSDGADWRSE